MINHSFLLRLARVGIQYLRALQLYHDLFSFHHYLVSAETKSVINIISMIQIEYLFTLYTLNSKYTISRFMFLSADI